MCLDICRYVRILVDLSECMWICAYCCVCVCINVNVCGCVWICVYAGAFALDLVCLSVLCLLGLFVFKMAFMVGFLVVLILWWCGGI